MPHNKIRNEYRNGFTRNFSKYIIDRYILIDNDLMNNEQKDSFIKTVNEELWYAIQETNMLVENRILPFVVVRRVDYVDNKLRIVVNDYDSPRKLCDYDEVTSLDISMVSHIINFKPLSPQRRVMICDELIPGAAKILIDEKEQVSAAVDIFLDIAMFNSIPFFRNLSIKKKKEFSKDKFLFYKKRKLRSYYVIDKKDPPSYFSFAFYARTSSEKIDFYKYVWIWDEFISQYSQVDNITEIAPEEIIRKYYVDIGNLENELLSREYWELQTKGAKLLLRINKGPNTNEAKQIISSYFGINSFYIGAIKIVPLNEYFKPFIFKQLHELYISAFKIIV